jgi:hypothetical protein
MESDLHLLSPRLSLSKHRGVLTVYLDQRVLVQVSAGRVTAFQTYNLAQAHLANKVLEILELRSRYLITVGSIIEFKDGLPVHVYTMKELLCLKESLPSTSKQ